MKKIYLVLLFLITLKVIAIGSVEKKDLKLSFSGFIKYCAMYDTRQTVNAREGHFLLYPEAPLYDSENIDINSAPNFNMTTISSTLKFSLDGSEVLNARSQAFIEFDCWGSKNCFNLFRVRHAYAKLDWGNTKLIFGQYWHPMSVVSCFPKIVSANSGVPFHPISRNPQIRLVHEFGILQFTACLFTQRDFTSIGPDGASSQYLRNSGIPEVHFQLQCGNALSGIQAGAGIDYKKLVPEIYTENDEGETFATKESLSGISTMGFISAKTKYFIVNAQGIYAQNSYDMMMLGGYAVKKTTDKETGEKEFSNLNTLSSWVDFQSKVGWGNLGFFIAYTKNMGAGEIIEGPIYARGGDIDCVCRFSARLGFDYEDFNISLEGELTNANYGIKNGDGKGGVTDARPVSNFRTLLSFKYSF